MLGGNMYIYGENKDTREVINAFPCFICKKMIINAGLNRIITSVKNNEKGYMCFTVDEWIEEWKSIDIIDDRYKYGQ